MNIEYMSLLSNLYNVRRKKCYVAKLKKVE